MSKAPKIEKQVADVFGANEKPKVLSAWIGKTKAVCGNVVMFTARDDVFATHFVADSDGSNASA